MNFGALRVKELQLQLEVNSEVEVGRSMSESLALAVARARALPLTLAVRRWIHVSASDSDSRASGTHYCTGNWHRRRASDNNYLKHWQQLQQQKCMFNFVDRDSEVPVTST